MTELILERFTLIVRRLEEILLITGTAKTVYSADSYTSGSEIFESRIPVLLLLGTSSPEEKSITFLNNIKTLNKTITASFRRCL
jgi:hypothetical protein